MQDVAVRVCAKSLDKTSGDSSRSNQHPKPASAGWMLAAAGRLRVVVASVHAFSIPRPVGCSAWTLAMAAVSTARARLGTGPVLPWAQVVNSVRLWYTGSQL